MASKSLSEVYAGVLSRRWDVLMDAVDAGSPRVVAYNAIGRECADLLESEFSHGRRWYMGLSKSNHTPQTRESMIEWLDEHGVGFFPANDSEL